MSNARPVKQSRAVHPSPVEMPLISVDAPLPSSRQRLLQSAERLFAERGIDAVGVRDIAADAGFKNGNSLTYHFHSKENLVREVLLAGAISAENCRRRLLNRLRADNVPMTTRTVLKVLCAPSVAQAVTPSYALLARRMMISRRDYFFALLGNELMATPEICHALLRDQIGHLPPEIIEYRIRLCDLYINDFVATRYVHMRLGTDEVRWASRAMIENFLDTAEAILTTPPSPQSLATARADRDRAPAAPGVAVRYDLFDDLWAPEPRRE